MRKADELDYYRLLGVSRNATSEQIKHAYREIAKVYHPDSQHYSDLIDDPPGDDDLDLFKRVSFAYDTLIDEASRMAYDRCLTDYEQKKLPHDSTSVNLVKINPATVGNSHKGGDPTVLVGPRPLNPSSTMRLAKEEIETVRLKIELARRSNGTLGPRQRRGLADYVLIFFALGLPLLTGIGAMLFLIMNKG